MTTYLQGSSDDHQHLFEKHKLISHMEALHNRKGFVFYQSTFKIQILPKIIHININSINKTCISKILSNQSSFHIKYIVFPNYINIRYILWFYTFIQHFFYCIIKFSSNTNLNIENATPKTYMTISNLCPYRVLPDPHNIIQKTWLNRPNSR